MTSAIFILPFSVVLFFLHGVALSVLWGWFLVPFGLPPIGLAWAVGLGCVSGMLVPTPPPVSKDDAFNHQVSIFLKPIVVLCVGFVAKSFM